MERKPVIEEIAPAAQTVSQRVTETQPAQRAHEVVQQEAGDVSSLVQETGPPIQQTQQAVSQASSSISRDRQEVSAETRSTPAAYAQNASESVIETEPVIETFEQHAVGAGAFRHDVSNLIQAVPGTCSAADAAALGVPVANCAQRANVAAVRSQGFELEAGAKPFDWLYLETGYMYLDSRDRDTGSFLFTRSPHAWKTRVRVEYAGWDLTTRIRYFSSFGFSDLSRNNLIDPNEKAPSNVQLDVRLAYQLKNGIQSLRRRRQPDRVADQRPFRLCAARRPAVLVRRHTDDIVRRT